MLEIHVQNTDVTAGSIPVSWCTDKETLQSLKYYEIKNPHVVLIVAPVNNYSMNQEIRKLVPLKDMMAWIEFERPGPHRIFAFISTKDFSSKKSVYEYKESVIEKNDGRHLNMILNYDGDDFRNQYLERKDIVLSSPILVNVPEEIFAKKAPEWELNWVNHFFSSNPRNQCEYRRRRIFAYTLQPILSIFIYLASFVFMAITLCLFLQLPSIKAFAKLPLDCFITIMNDTNPANTKNILWSLESQKGWKQFVLVPFNPIVMLFEFFIGLLIVHLCTNAPLVLPILLAIGILVGIIWCLIKFRHKIADFVFPKEDPFWYANEDDQRAIVCTGEQKPVSIKALPPKYRTIKLRYQDLKSKVCKPFAR